MRLVDSVLTVIAPNDCLNCGAEGKVLCEACRSEFIAPLPSRCFHCQKLTISSSLCTSAKREYGLKHLWVSTNYSSVAKYLVKELKFNGKREATKIIAQSIAETLPYLLAETLIIPIPTTTNHVRQRGFDHTRAIAKEVARIKGCQYEPNLARFDQHSQVGSKREQRQKQLNDSMYSLKPLVFSDSKVLLIDDVATTGSTIKEAARVMKQHGVTSVDAAVFAQKVL